jgi:hypothetical protein
MGCRNLRCRSRRLGLGDGQTGNSASRIRRRSGADCESFGWERLEEIARLRRLLLADRKLLLDCCHPNYEGI